jgi:hypothetical protein
VRSGQILVTSCLLLLSTTAAGQKTPLVSQDPLEGYADIHVHQMANRGFGGSIIWGAAWGPHEEALNGIPANIRGHDSTEVATHGKFRTLKGYQRLFLGLLP